MSCLLALTLLVTDPAILLGGPDHARVQTRQVQEHRESVTETRRGSYGYERYAAPAQIPAPQYTPEPLKAGDPVRLDRGFFHGPLVGGVEQSPPRIIVTRTHHRHHWTERRSH